jgi:rod shape-determining protein MreD
MSTLVKNSIRFILFILIQVFVLDSIHLHKLATPYLYLLFIIWLPFRMNRSWQLLIAFIFGFTLDAFRHSFGFHAAACVLMAYIRPYFINLLIPQQGIDSNYEEPSIKSMGGFTPYFIFISALTIIHHSWLFLLEAWQVGNSWYFLAKTFLSTAISLLLIIITELLFTRKQKFKTNTI